MNGAESLVHTLLKCGVDTCFANPGTSEMHFVAALDRIAGMRCVLCLQENVVTGAADGYYRITGKPAATLLHCGPGLANGLANLHNARRARSGIVNVVGDQATYHRPLDAPLTADAEGWARPVSTFVRTVLSSNRVGDDAAAAVQAARVPPGRIATLILPSDASWDDGGVVGTPLPGAVAPAVDPHAVKHAARVLREKKNVLLLLGGEAVHAALAAARLAHRRDDRRQADDRALERPHRARPGPPAARARALSNDAAVKALAPFEHLILVNAVPPVGFFAYPGKPSRHTGRRRAARAQPLRAGRRKPRCRRWSTSSARRRATFPATARSLPSSKASRRRKTSPTCIAAVMPEGAVIVDESVSYGRGFFRNTHAAAPHDWLQIMGGAIGAGIPLAVGAAIGLRAQGANDAACSLCRPTARRCTRCRACGRRRARSCR